MWMMPLHLHVNQKSDYDYDEQQLYSCIFNTYVKICLNIWWRRMYGLKHFFVYFLSQGCKINFLLTRPVGLVGGKKLLALMALSLPLITDHTCT